MSRDWRIIAGCSLAAAAALPLVIHVNRLWKEQSKQKASRLQSLLSEYEGPMEVSLETLHCIRDEMLRQVRAGLRGEPSSLLMLPSMVDVLPNGEETGEFYAIDLGGTNFRVLYVRLSDENGQVAELDMKDCPLEDRFFSCEAHELFDLLAGSLIDFRRGRLSRKGTAGPCNGAMPAVGFCFSFPCDQEGLAKATVKRLTKRLEIEGLVGADPVQLLSESFARLGMPMRVTALLNDSVGTLAGGRYVHSDANLGVILGTGTNACYVERIENIAKLPPQAPGHAWHSPYMLVNTEWGNFAANALPITQVDREIDAATPNAGEQPFEKMMSGMYMGEIARRILLHLAEDGGLFGAQVPERLREPGSFTTPKLAKIVEDASPRLSLTAQLLAKSFGLWAWGIPADTRAAAQRVCRLVAQRSARLAAAGIAALLGHIHDDEPGMPATTVAVDGGVFEHFLAYRGFLTGALAELLGPDVAPQLRIEQIRDASSMGAAYLAAAAQRVAA